MCETPDELLDVLNRLTSVGLEIAQVKNKFASPTPMGYRDFNLNIRVRLDDGSTHIAEFQLNLKSIADAKHIAHDQYEVIRAALPDMCKDTSVGAEALEAFISERLNSSALDAAVGALERKAGGLMLYARLIADQLEATSGESTLRASARCRRASTDAPRTFGACLSMMVRGAMRCRWWSLCVPRPSR